MLNGNRKTGKKNRREATSNRLMASAERPVTIILLTIGLSVTGKKTGYRFRKINGFNIPTVDRRFPGLPRSTLVFLLHLLPLEMTSTGFYWPDSTSRSFQCMEDGSLSRTLAFNCGHGYTQEEYAVKSETERFL